MSGTSGGARRDFLFAFMGALLLGGGILIGVLVVDGDDTGSDDVVSVGVTEPAPSVSSSEPTSSTSPSTVVVTTATASTTTTAIVDAPIATTTSSAMTTTRAPTTTTISPTTTATTTTQPPGDEEGPRIFSLQSTETDIWESANYGGCPTQQQTTQISAIVQDPAGIARVFVAGQAPSKIGSNGWEVPEIAPGVYSGTLGPFPDDYVTEGQGVLRVTMTAWDNLGNTTSVWSDSLLVIHNCSL